METATCAGLGDTGRSSPSSTPGDALKENRGEVDPEARSLNIFFCHEIMVSSEDANLECCRDCNKH